MILKIIEVLRYFNIAYIILIIFFFIKEIKRSKNIAVSILFNISIIAYLLIYRRMAQQSIETYIIIGISYTSSFFFWLFSKGIFDDKFKLTIRYLFYFLIVISITMMAHYLRFNAAFKYRILELFIRIVPQIFQTFFILLAYQESKKTKEKDLINLRIN